VRHVFGAASLVLQTQRQLLALKSNMTKTYIDLSIDDRLFKPPGNLACIIALCFLCGVRFFETLIQHPACLASLHHAGSTKSRYESSNCYFHQIPYLSKCRISSDSECWTNLFSNQPLPRTLSGPEAEVITTQPRPPAQLEANTANTEVKVHPLPLFLYLHNLASKPDSLLFIAS
jgi:hypothetical protein